MWAVAPVGWAVVRTVNAAVVSPSATTTTGSTLAMAGSLLLTCTEAPPAGAGPDRVTVACEG